MKITPTLSFFLACLSTAAVYGCSTDGQSLSGAGGAGGEGSNAGVTTGNGASNASAATGTSTSSSGGTGGSASSGTGSGGSPPVAPPACYPTCSTAADCAGPTALTDADNYACNAGKCDYLGCNSTTECTSTYMSPNYSCVALSGSSIKSCYPTCSSAADCAGPTALTDVDNYACNGGLCEYLGCNSTTECTSTYMNPNYTCVALSGSSIKSCYPTCSTAADCAGPTALTDADNYACNGGLCEYLGCNSTAECTMTFMNPNYICD